MKKKANFLKAYVHNHGSRTERFRIRRGRQRKKKTP